MEPPTAHPPLPRTSAQSRSLALLFVEHGAMVYGLALRLLGGHEETREATEALFIRLIAGEEALPPAGEVVPWLWRLAAGSCQERLRSSGRRGVLLESQGGPDCPSDLLLHRLRAGEVDGPRAQLPRRHAMGCERCQARMARDAAGFAAWDEADPARLLAAIRRGSAGL